MNQEKRPYNKLVPIPFSQVKIDDMFWSKRQDVNQNVAIQHQYKKLEEANNIDNFRVAAKLRKGSHRGEFYYDSGVYKWLEAACYVLNQGKDEVLEKKVNEIVKLILNSQTDDGYINTFFSINFLEKRFSNTTFMHELYCAGHLIEAAVAHYNATGLKNLLDAIMKYADLIYSTFMEDKKKYPPGHQEIELALIKLYRLTNNIKYLNLADDFINRRGLDANSKIFILKQFLHLNSTLKESRKKGSINENENFFADLTLLERFKFYKSMLNGSCYQLRTPVREIRDPMGHAVRAMYMFSGMADLYSEKGDISLLKVLTHCWSKITEGKMYITGGIGSIKGIEGFEKDYKLKINKSYSETCAAVGFLLWNWKMLQITGEIKYAEIIEKILYNSLLVGESLDGTKYSYTNPLESKGEYERQEWFPCSCCPPNIARTLASLGNYLYSTSENTLYIHQYIGSTLDCMMDGIHVKVNQESQFPWQGKVKLRISSSKNYNFNLYLRIPKWSQNTEIEINGEGYNCNSKPGTYLKILRNWSSDDSINISLEFQPILIQGNPRRKDIENKVCISNGPLIYCLEQGDNEAIDIFSLKIQEESTFSVIYKDNMLDGVNIIEGKISGEKKFRAIPYFVWNNRGPDEMRLWFDKS
jgi:DUF1680 family protein